MRSFQVQATLFDAISQRDRGEHVDPWHPRYLLRAPHRLAFFTGLVMLMLIGIWWSILQMGRMGWLALSDLTIAPALVHSSLMVWGFFPILFSGFLFTAGPKWLNVPPPRAGATVLSIALQMTGWIIWLAGAYWSAPIALAGLAMATVGLVRTTIMFLRLVRHSDVPDQIHAKLIAGASVLGCLSLGGLVFSVAFNASEAARACVLTGLWGFVMAVFVAVSHRMIPFFTSSAMPMVTQWKPFWILWLMIATLGLKAISAWMEMLLWPSGHSLQWLVSLGIVELLTGAILIWIAFAWGLVQSLRNRLLAMLHIGFVWLGVSVVFQGAAHLMASNPDASNWSLGALHAATLGCLMSLTFAMVTRVSCGHSGRSLVADNWTWASFWVLQAAAFMRVVAGLGISLPSLMPLSALAFLLAVLPWAGRLLVWYGQPRADGRDG